MDFLQFVVTVTVGHITVGNITVGNITVVCNDSWQKLQLSAITVGRSYSCLQLQLAEITDNILHLSANRLIVGRFNPFYGNRSIVGDEPSLW